MQGTAIGDEEKWNEDEWLYTSNLYPDTFMLSYGGDDGADQRYSRPSSLVPSVEDRTRHQGMLVPVRDS